MNTIQTTIIGYKGCDFFAILDELNPDTSWWQNLAVWLQPLLFQAQFTWHEKHLQKGWPSGLCPNGLSCTVYHATSGLVGGYGASWQYEDCDTCPSCQRRGPEWKTKLIYFHFYLFNLSWLHQVLLGVCVLLSCTMHVGSSSLTRDWTRVPCIGGWFLTTAPRGKSWPNF